MEIESLRIQIILSIKPKKQTAKKPMCMQTKIRLLSPIDRLNSYQTNFVFLSQWISDQTSEARWDILDSTYSYNFFCGDIKTVALKSFLYRNRKCYLFLFMPLWLQQELFLHKQRFLSAWSPACSALTVGPFWRTEGPLFRSRIHNMANGCGSFSSTKEAQVFVFSVKTTKETRYNYRWLSSKSD